MEKTRFTIQLAEKNIEIESICPELKTFCQAYLTDCSEKLDFSISWTEETLLAEQRRLQETGSSLLYLETFAALRAIAEQLPQYDRMVFHGAAITYNDGAYLFAAPSGTGKTTHIRLWKEYLGAQTDIVNGDKPILSVEGSNVRVHGTPWAGKENWHKNRSAALKGICFLQQAKENMIQRLEPSQCLERLMKQVYLPEDRHAAGRTLELLDGMVRHVPVYLLYCNISEDAVRYSFEEMTGLDFITHRRKYHEN